MSERNKKIIFVSIIIFLILGFLEISCYILLKLSALETRGRRDWHAYYKNSGLYKDIDIDVFYNEQKIINSNLSFDFYRYYRPMANFEGRYISTDNEGFRKTAQYFKDKKLKKKTIIFLGGSTMWGVGAAGDSITITSLFGKYLNEMDPEVNYEVRNYGVGGYQNTQEMILLLEKLGTEDIDFVIFFDWVNEAIMGYRELLDGNNKLNFLQPSVNAGYSGIIKFLSDRGVYDEVIKLSTTLRWISEKSSLFKIVSRLKNAIASNAKTKRIENNREELTRQEQEQAERIVKLYDKNTKIIESLSKTFNFKAYFIMQPNLFTKEKLSNYEEGSPHWKDVKSVNFQRKVYELAKKEFTARDGFCDISGCMTTDETIYVDDHHTSVKGNDLIAKAILNRIGAEIMRISRD